MGPIFFSAGNAIIYFLVFLRILHITLYNTIDFTQEPKKGPTQKNPETRVSLFVKRKCFLQE